MKSQAKDLFSRNTATVRDKKYCSQSVSEDHNSVLSFYCFLKAYVNIFNPIALRTAQTPYSFGRSECNRVKILYKNWLTKAVECRMDAKMKMEDLLSLMETICMEKYPQIIPITISYLKHT